jgi:preprotein translocase subunit YajC
MIGAQFLGVILIVYFLFIRPQRKEQERHREMVGALKKGDRIVSTGGLVGVIVKADERTLIVQTGDARVEIERHRVARLFAESSTDDA